MSDDEADPELLALLRQSLGLGPGISTAPPSTGVLKSAQYICDNAIDVAISSGGTKTAAETIWGLMQAKRYSTETWSSHELHPKTKDEATVNFIFTMNLLNFSFWSELPPEERFTVEYRGHRWTGYWSLVAALQRALDEGTFGQSHDPFTPVSLQPCQWHTHLAASSRVPNHHAMLLDRPRVLPGHSSASCLPLCHVRAHPASIPAHLDSPRSRHHPP